MISDHALAIPSPDIALNLSASVAQFLGVMSVVFAALAFMARKRASNTRQGWNVTGKLMLLIAGLMLLGSLAANVLQYTGSVDARNQRLQTNLLRTDDPLSADSPLATHTVVELPDFANKNVLLDTPEVHQLVDQHGAQFIDVRDADAFVSNHLPKAVHIPVNALSSARLSQRISTLRGGPYIAACYDKRSCFHSQVVGLQLQQAGLDFLGRYTVPHEYYIDAASGDGSLQERAQDPQALTLASYLLKPLRSVLDYLVDITGHYVPALISLVLLVHLLLLPLTIKAVRDARVQRALSKRITHLKEELSNHPRALSDATSQLHQRFGIHPVLGLLDTACRWSLLLLFAVAVSQHSMQWTQRFQWIESGATQDPLLILPALAAMLLVGFLMLTSPARTLLARLLFLAGGAALFWLLHERGAALSLFLLISLAALIMQSLLLDIVGKALGWDAAAPRKSGFVHNTGLIPLSHAHYLPEYTGNTAARLGQLIEAGYNVPDGFVFTSEITNKNRHAPDQPLLTRSQGRTLDTLWKNLATREVSVRRSGTNEKTADSPLADIEESFLAVSRNQLDEAVKTVYQSLCSERSALFSQSLQEGDIPILSDQGGVLVQKIIPAQYAGVLLTEHPNTTGAMMVQLTSGSGEALAGDQANIDTFAFGKLTCQLLQGAYGDNELPPLDIKPLLALGRELEAMFGQAQHIQWTYAKGSFYVLQTQDIGRSIGKGHDLKNLAERERGNLLQNLLGERKRLRRSEQMDPDEIVFEQGALSALLPRPTPLSAELMHRLWSAGGSTDLACQDLGIPYQVHFRSAPYLNTLFGWTYTNRLEKQRRLGKGVGALTSFRLIRDADEATAMFHDQFLPGFQEEMVERSAIAMERLTLEAATTLLANWIKRFVENTNRTAERINISAQVHVKTAKDKLAAANLNAAHYLHEHSDTVLNHAIPLLNAHDASAENIEAFLLMFGHRAPLDFELAEPRFNEDTNLMLQYFEHLAATKPSAFDEDLDALPDNKILATAVQRARQFVHLKEEARNYCLIELAQIRRLLLAIDAKCQLSGLIFHLQLNEVAQLANPAEHAQLLATARQRFEDAHIWEPLSLPATLSISDLERMDFLTGVRPDYLEQSDTGLERIPEAPEDSLINPSQLRYRKLLRHEQRLERRALKDALSDRRSVPRFTATGEVERDRRAANRAENIKIIKKAG